MGFFSFQKTSNPHNICKGFNIIGIKSFDAIAMVVKLHPTNNLSKNKIKIQAVNLQVEDVLNEYR